MSSWRILLAAMVAGAALVGPGLPGEAAWAQGGSGAGPMRLEAPLLDASHAQRAHRLVEGWVRQAEVDEAAAAPIEVSGAFGLRVTLRISGVTVGAGEAYRADVEATANPDRGGPVDLVPLLQEATRRALTGAQESLLDANLRAVMEGNRAPSVEPPTVAELAPRLLVDLQVGHRLETIRLPAKASPSAVYGTFAPGFHGLRLFTGVQGADAFGWPATALARNITPKSQLIQLIDALGGRVEDLPHVARPGGVGLQRFEVIHLVRPQSDQPVIELVRGGVVLPPHTIGERTLDALADRLAQHLHRRFAGMDGLVRGTYHPTRDRYEPELASDEEAALASYALIRHSRYLGGRRADGQPLTQAAQAAQDAAAAIGGRALDPARPPQPAAAALVLLTLIDSPQPVRDPALRDGLGARILSLADPEAGFRAGPAADAGPVNEATRALMVAALAALYEQTRAAAVGEIVSRELEALWTQTQASPNIAALPWLMLAHSRAAHLLAGDDAQQQALVAAREAGLSALVVQLCEQQVIDPPLLGPSDVVGGFALSAGPAGSPPNPDWRTSQLLMFLGMALREPGVTEPHEQIGWTVTGGLAARFLAQLMFDEPGSYYVRSLADTQGGIRLSLWDNRLAVAPQAMTLLAVTELQEALAHFRYQNARQ